MKGSEEPWFRVWTNREKKRVQHISRLHTFNVYTKDSGLTFNIQSSGVLDAAWVKQKGPSKCWRNKK
jgi:hypothetical protein